MGSYYPQTVVSCDLPLCLPPENVSLKGSELDLAQISSLCWANKCFEYGGAQ